MKFYIKKSVLFGRSQISFKGSFVPNLVGDDSLGEPQLRSVKMCLTDSSPARNIDGTLELSNVRREGLCEVVTSVFNFGGKEDVTAEMKRDLCLDTGLRFFCPR